MAMDFRVYKADDGRAVVQSKYDDFVACYRHGEWVNDMVFDPIEMQDIPLVEDSAEASNIISQAKRALSRW
jgi:hypothetical protein